MTNTVGVIGTTFAVVIFLDGFLRWLLNHTPQSGLSVVDRARAKRLGGAEQLDMFDVALTTGVVPPGADRPRWSRELDRWNPQRALAPENLLSWVVALGFVWQAAIWAIPKSFDEILSSNGARWASGILATGLLVVAGYRVWRRLSHSGESKVDERKRLRETLDHETAAYRVVSERRSLVSLSGRRYRS
ncbi:hypothetical protein [Aeromicrobium sp.]|uniref:hypothetical protein n=1 Tax=Aeromicrobium sp. TaxID=1871063 RepID=UPI002FC76A72